jgi:outer membrane usher protein
VSTTASVEDPRASLTAQHQTLFGRYEVSYDQSRLGPHVELAASGALVWVPGAGVLPTLPVYDGYGVIRVRGVPGVRGALNNQPIGATNARGTLLVPNLYAYYGNRLGITDSDVPLGYTVGSTERVVAPPYRGPAVAEFDVSRPHYYRGTLRVRSPGGAARIPAYGQITIRQAGGPLASPIAKDGAFELEGLVEGRYDAVVEDGEGVCAMTLSIPGGDSAVIELGTLDCQAR